MLGVYAMQMLVIVLNKVDKVESLFKEFINIGVRGATIIDSKGMLPTIVTNHPLCFSFLYEVTKYNLRRVFFCACFVLFRPCSSCWNFYG